MTSQDASVLRPPGPPAAQPVDAHVALREMRDPSLLVALDYLELLADVRPDKFDKAAVRWHRRLELESAVLTIAESQLALAALGALRGGDQLAVAVLRKLVGQGQTDENLRDSR